MLTFRLRIISNLCHKHTPDIKSHVEWWTPQLLGPPRTRTRTPIHRQRNSLATGVWAVILCAVLLLGTLPRQSDGARRLANFVALRVRRHTDTRVYNTTRYIQPFIFSRHPTFMEDGFSRAVCADHFRYKNYSAWLDNYLVGERIIINRNRVRAITTPPHITPY